MELKRKISIRMSSSVDFFKELTRSDLSTTRDHRLKTSSR
ncbi:hypothetical protein P689_122216 [Candidatus Riesia pediculischaeffi PTSU]|uniref:Uncharacterized protein n=1 Tax=Candidatus Riesia pediculischaeffi PTSU TaxID=1401651 RepID=A0A0C1V5N6_9ENTR|nr:hypothetical protein P689_122216 [Candidatus Riesia pediculischaeffi PTSU]